MSRETRFEVNPDAGVITLPRHLDKSKWVYGQFGRRVSAEDGVIVAQHEAEDKALRALGDSKHKGKYGKLLALSGGIQPVSGSTADPAMIARLQSTLQIHAGEAGIASLKDATDEELLKIKGIAEKTLAVAREIVNAAAQPDEADSETAAPE